VEELRRVLRKISQEIKWDIDEMDIVGVEGSAIPSTRKTADIIAQNIHT
jgi:hypothetical protein